MNLEVELPDLGLEGGNEAIVAEWHFEEGDCVEKGEVLLEVSCESGMVDVHAPCSGVLLERVGHHTRDAQLRSDCGAREVKRCAER